MLRQLKVAIAGLLERGRRVRAARNQRAKERHVTRAELVDGLRKLGVQRGDTIFVHSSLKSLGYVVGGPEDVLVALQDSVGDDGTLVMPTYYLPAGTIHETCKLTDYCFDIRRYGTNMGRLPETFLQLPGVCRSLHPTHSVSAWGRHARFLTEAHHLAPSIFGLGSPWQRLLELHDSKVLGLGISMGPVTFYHLLEDQMGDAFPIRVWEEPTCQITCIDSRGCEWSVPVRPYRPELMKQRIDNISRSDLRDYFADEFDRKGLRRTGTVGESDSWLIESHAFLKELRRLAGRGITIYSSPEQLAAERRAWG